MKNVEVIPDMSIDLKLFFSILQDMHAREKSGLETICRRIRDGQKVCTEVAQYFKLRYMYTFKGL